MINYNFDLMTLLISNREPENFDEIWDEFWTLSRRIENTTRIEWCDPDTTYYEDIMARYHAVQSYVRG